jgi:hypothetical protein
LLKLFSIKATEVKKETVKEAAAPKACFFNLKISSKSIFFQLLLFLKPVEKKQDASG